MKVEAGISWFGFEFLPRLCYWRSRKVVEFCWGPFYVDVDWWKYEDTP